MKRTKRILSCTLALLLALLPLLPQPAFAVGEYPEVVYNPYVEYSRQIIPSTIPVGTLLIGTHLIYMPMLNDKLYEMAIASAAESGQTSVYYKSDLAGGSWFEIGTASSVADIATTGAAVADSVIAQLKSTHHTKADGITYLTLNGGQGYNGNWSYLHLPGKDFPINVYTHMKYNDAVREFPEFISFYNQYLTYIRSAPTVGYTQFMSAYSEINSDWDVFVSWNETRLDSLETLRRELVRRGASKQQLDVVMRLMDEIDNNRRIDFLKQCDATLKKATSKVLSEIGPESQPPEMFLMAVSNTQKALYASIAKLQGRLMKEGTTSQAMLRDKLNSDLKFLVYYPSTPGKLQYDKMIKKIDELVNLENIMASDIVNREAELDLLGGKLIYSAIDSYKSELKTASNKEYDEAVKTPAAVALRERIINEHRGVLNNKQTELEQLILEMVDRSSKEYGISTVRWSLTNATYEFSRGLAKGKPFYDSASASLDAHIEFLKRLLKSLTGEESPTEQLQKEKLKLQDELMQALDENKTDEADKIREKIDEVGTEITALEENYAYEVALLEEEIKKTEGEIKDAPEEEVEELAKKLAEAKDKLSDIKVGSTDDSLIKVVEDLKKDGGDAIDRGDKGAVDVVLDSLISVAEQEPRVVVPAIKDIHDKMVGKDDGGGFKDQIAKAEDAIRDNANTVTETTKPKTEREIELIVGEYDPDEDKRNAAVVAALGEYVYTEAGRGMEDLWKSWLDKLLADNNPYVFVRYNDGDNEYIPYDVLGFFAGMRPVWYQNQQIGTLSKGGDYYSFKVDSTKVGRDKDSTKNDEMTVTAKWQTVVHVHESYTKLKFDCEAFYIPNSIYGVLVSPEIKVMLDEILGKIEDAGKTP